MEQSQARKPFPIKKIIGISVIIVIVGVFVWFIPTIISTIQNLGYTRVAVSANSTTTIQFGDNVYVFGYSPPKFGLQGTSTYWLPRAYNATQGSVYRDAGLEMKVSEVRSDYIVLLVKPL
jgi:hypothetical protein